MLHALLLAAGIGWALPLDGPWKFHTGDDLRWASPVFSDAAWATQNLAAPADANDGDQGITHFAPGWAAQGFSGYQGFAWYRIRVDDPLLQRGDLAILGPAMADSAYQIYADGRLIGGIGSFSGPTPLAYAIHPAMYGIPAAQRPLVIAVRVWMGPWAAGPRSGGMRVAPVIGNADGVRNAYAVQWFEKIRAFSLEIVQTCLFVLLAMAALLLVPLQPNKRGPISLAVALLLTAAQRAHLTVLWCLSLESIPTFFIVSRVLVAVTLAAWLLTWMFWLDTRKPRLAYAIGGLMVLYLLTALLKWAPVLASIERYAFLALLVLIVYLGLRERRRETLVALPAIVLIAVGQFGLELVRLGVPGIWFPFGMGVSLANYAYLTANLALFALLYSTYVSASCS